MLNDCNFDPDLPTPCIVFLSPLNPVMPVCKGQKATWLRMSQLQVVAMSVFASSFESVGSVL